MTDENKGLWLGFIGVAIFALTLPLTRIAVHEINPSFLAIGRTVLAAAVAGPMLFFARARRPHGNEWGILACVIAGVIFGFPLLSAFAMKTAPASHGGVVLGVLPLATAIMSTLFAGERPSPVFWFWSITGSLAVVIYALWDGGAELHAADSLLFLSVIAASMGYAGGGRLARTLGGWQVICWALVVALPFTLPLAAWFARELHPDISGRSWACFLYVALMSQLGGFFFWNRGLSLGGIARVGQVQLLQTFMTLVASALLIGEHITLRACAFALIVSACVWSARKTVVRRTAA